MEIKDMNAFYAIVEEGNISHAAQRLNVAQPALSRQMKRLEDSLGVKLFERGSRRIRLTEAGRLLYSRVEHILGMVDGTECEIREIGTGVAGSVRIGTITTSGAMLLPDLLAKFRKEYPQVTFQLWEGEGARILELLDNRVIELAITRTQVDQNNYDSLTLSNEPLGIAMNREGCICGGSEKVIRLIELRDQPMIVPLRWKTLFVTKCRKLGFEPNIICVSDSIIQDVLLTKKNIGMALLPMSAQSMLSEGSLVYKKLIDPEISTHTVVAWLKNRTLSSSCRHLIEAFKKMYMPDES